MELTCIRCETDFDSGIKRGYCDECLSLFRERQILKHYQQNPAPGVHITGKFLKPKECPQSIENEAGDGPACGLCGGESLMPGYGFAGGYGLGSYQFCEECNTVIDFSEDLG